MRAWLLVFALIFISLLFANAQTGTVVTIDSNQVMSINGKKVFPITLSPGPPNNGKTPDGSDALDELRGAGALMFRIAQSENWNSEMISNQQVALDWAAQHGMYCLVNLRELSAFSSGDTNTEASLRATVNLFKNHPALGVWKNKDEAWWAGTSADNLQRGYDVIKQEDPNHPIEQTHAPRGTVQDLQPYNSAADILALDIYPVSYPPGANSLLTNKELSMIGDYADFLSQVGEGQKHFWMVEQIAWSGVTPPAKVLRFPTFTEERFMAYQAIIHGARGLMYFGGNVTATLNPQDAALGWNWTFWNDVLKPVVRQLSDTNVLADALVAPNSLLPIQSSRSDVEFCLRDVPPYLYILACKREGVTTNVTFSGLPSAAALGEILYESPRTVTASNGQFTDWFGPFEVHAYRFLITNQSPIILTQPQSQTVYIGSSATFGVSATGSGTLSYQWRHNGLALTNALNISGATTSSLTLSNVIAEDAGSYDVIVSGFGSVTSTPAILTAVTNIIPPTFTSQPQSRTNYSGTTASFSVSVTGSGPFAYQWKRNGTNLVNGGNISGATSSSLALFAVGSADAATYQVAVTGAGGTSNSLPATLAIVQSSASILYEPFDYSNVGSPVSSNAPANWAFNGSNPNDLNVSDGNLSYSGLATSVGNSVTNGGAGLGVRRLFGAGISSGNLYFSGLFRVNDIGTQWSGATAQVGALTATDNTNFRLAVMAALTTPTNYIFGLQKGGTGVSPVYEFIERQAGETVFLVGKYDFTSSPHRVTLWINPPSSTLGTTSAPTNGFITTTSGSDGAIVIDRFNMRQNTAASVPAAMQWDELRFGVTWAEVTPPGPLTMLILTNVVQRADGAFEFSYDDSSATQNYSIYASTNMVDWAPIGPATRVGPTRYRFTDTAASSYVERFYQLRATP